MRDIHTLRGDPYARRKYNLKMTVKRLKEKASWIRREVFEMAMRAGKGHLGGAFSCVEILVALYYGGILRVSPKTKEHPLRDRFILSKGHDCLSLYVILADLGFFDVEELGKHGKNDSMLGGHPDHFIPGVEISSGSLGHGLGIACGLALSAKLNRYNFITVALLGDGECMEGSVWEATSFAAAQKLNNLVAIVDNNKIGATDFIKNYGGSASLEKKWRSFGWDALVVDGHNFDEIFHATKSIRKRISFRPLAIIANTVKGKGVSFMENDPHWHHGIPKGEFIDRARKELSLT